MNLGVVFIIILIVPVLGQVLMLAYQSKKRHEEILQAIKRLENKI